MKHSYTLLFLAASLLVCAASSVKLEELDNDPLFEVKNKHLHVKAAEKQQKPAIDEGVSKERQLELKTSPSITKLGQLITMVQSFKNDPNFDVGVKFVFATDKSLATPVNGARRLEQKQSHVDQFMKAFLAINKDQMRQPPSKQRFVKLMTKSQKFSPPKGLFRKAK